MAKARKSVKLPAGVLAKIKRGKPATFALQFELEPRGGVLHLRARLLPHTKEIKAQP